MCDMCRQEHSVLSKESSPSLSGIFGYTAHMNKQHITLSEDDRSMLERLLSHGTLSAKKFKRATALLELDRGKTLGEVTATLQLTYPTVSTWRDRYNAQG